ncbi:DUF979 family protein [uncultured Aquimonas sp.]|uniref:5-oxoproline transporter, DUF979 family subunit n=1 Tax=uncultured Aquimonas sp. TaxID=385483 RepID=UPI00086F4179|nr:DUF979 family protein [uncultured Aquimonas sp.]ODU45055.1 MAG: permease [Xanthomonadaceae bacterium SCN 69-123]
MISLPLIYLLAGLFVARIAWLSALDASNPRRAMTAAFWGLLALSFLIGDRLPAVWMGGVVVALALLAGFGGVRAGRVEPASADRLAAAAARFGHRLFAPALVIPLVTVAVVLFGADIGWGEWRLFGSEMLTQVGLGLACLLALLAACALTRTSPLRAVEHSRGLVDAIGWAALLPLLLATLGSVFAAAGVGEAVAELVRAWIPVDNRFVVVLAYALGMAGFTMVMGNAFAAFPVMTAGIGLPLLVQMHGADAASLAAIGMLSGYCGTLMTPMAANFNLVPAALLELRDPYAVIRVQIPTALLLLAANVVLMYFIVFRNVA